MMKKVLFMLAMLTCIFASCSDGGSEDPVNPTPKPEETKYEITIDSSIISNGVSFDAKAGENSISFTTNANWTLTVASTTSGATWCKASASSGAKGSATVKFTVEENTDYEDRSVSVTIKAGTVSKTFTITQKGADALLVTTNKYEVVQEGGKIEVEVKANIDYQMEISETAKGWISEASSRALKTYKHTLTIAPNEEAEKREGEITFKSGDKVETVKVYQVGGAILLLTQDEYTVSDAGEMITVEIKSNIEFGVQMPDVDWIDDEASSRGMSSHTLNYYIAPNEGYDTRSAEIIFYDKNSDLKDTLKVVQAQKDAIVISQKTYDVKAEGETIEVKLSANVDFEVTIPEVDWISQAESRALKEHTLYFKVAENEGEDSRSAEIIFVNKDSQLSEKVTISQKGIIVLSLSKDEYSVSDQGETISVDIKSNVEYGIKMPEVDWIKQETNSRGTSTQTLKFIVSANETYDSRSAEIVFYDKNSNVTDTLKVIQAQKDAIVLSQKTYEVKAEGETIEVKLSTNVDFEVNMPEVDWIKWDVSGRSVTTNTLKFIISPNNSNTDRSTNVIFYNNNKNISDTLTIVQYKKDISGNIVNVIEPGTLSEIIGESAKYSTKALKVTGKINGTDIRFLREMAGRDVEGKQTNGILNKLNLSKAQIVSGGEYYYKYYAERNVYCRTKDDIIGDFMFNNCLLKEISLPENTKEIGSAVFDFCTNLNYIDIPESVTTIGEWAFSKCYSLFEIKIPNNVIKIGDYAFYHCVFETIVLPENLDTIANSLFGGSELKSITIPEKVEYIGQEAFAGTRLSSIILPKNLKGIGDSAFRGTGLKTIEIPGKVESLGWHTFESCNLNEIIIAEGVKSISNSAFYHSGAKKVVLPSSLDTILGSAFQGCKIEEIYSTAKSAPEVYASVFDSSIYSSCKVYIPIGSLNSYQIADYWKNFTHIIEKEF